MEKTVVKGLVLLVALVVQLEGHGQNNAQVLRDSLEKALATAVSDTARIELINELASAWKHNDIQRTEELAGQALDLSRKVNYPRGEARALTLLGAVSYRLSEHEKAIERLRTAIALAEAIPDSSVLGMAIGNLGLVHMSLGNLPTALDHYQRQLVITRSIGDSLTLYRVLNNIGLLQRRAKNEEAALSYLRQALGMAEALGDRGNTASVLHNLAMSLDRTGQRDSALVYYQRALALNKKVGNDRFRATNHAALAMYFLEKDQSGIALAHADTALKIRERLGNLSEQATAHVTMSNILDALGKESEALKHMELSLKLSTEAGDRENILESMEAFARQLTGQGRYKEATHWFARHLALRDSLDKEEAAAKLANLQVAFDVAQKDARIEMLAEEERQQRALSELRQQQRDGWMLAAIALVLLVALGIVQVLRIRRLNIALAKARDRAERNERSMDHFLSIMGHEVRSPMAAAISSLNMAIQTSTDQERERYLDIAGRSMRGLLRIVNDLLDRSAIEAGTLRIDHVPFVPMEVLRNATQPFEALAAGKGIDLQVDLDGSLQTPRSGDPGRLNQVITNLIGNAVKYTDQGKVIVAASSGVDRIMLRVSDTGRGMSDAQRERLFTPFHRLEEGRSDPGGTGLGLYITAMLVQKMGGTINVESRPGEGTTFMVELPMAEGKNSLQEIDHEMQKSERTFFVVDDDPAERKRTAAILQKLHPTVTIMEAGHGDEFLKLLENYTSSFSEAILFTDLDMPQLSGFELVHILRNGPYSHIPCVAVSSSVLMLDPAELKALGFASVLSKPIEEERLIEVLKELKPDPGPGVLLP